MLTHGTKMTHLPQTRTLTIYLMGYFIELNYKKNPYCWSRVMRPCQFWDPNYSLVQTGIFAEKVTTYF